jgi:hypothetical protein
VKADLIPEPLLGGCCGRGLCLFGGRVNQRRVGACGSILLHRELLKTCVRCRRNPTSRWTRQEMHKRKDIRFGERPSHSIAAPQPGQNRRSWMSGSAAPHEPQNFESFGVAMVGVTSKDEGTLRPFLAVLGAW